MSSESSELLSLGEIDIGLGVSMHMSVDDPAGPDPLGVSPCHAFEVSPRNFGGGTFGGGGPFGGGGSGGLDDLLVAPEGEILREVLASVLIFLE